MTFRSIQTSLCAGLVAVMVPAWARADGVITGDAVAEIKRQPQVLRIHVELLSKDKTLKEALVKLKARRAAAEKQLAAWGVPAAAISFGEPAFSSDKTDQQVQMERMVNERLRRKGGKKTNEPAPSIVGLTLVAELPLKSKTMEELLEEFQDLKQKIQAADLSGIKELQKLSPQDEELVEESSPRNMYEGNEPRRGEPTLMLVARVSEEERTKALAEAYAKARAEAAQLARAAGVELGSLVNLSKASYGTGEEESYRMARYYYRNAPAISSGEMVHPGEAVTMQPAKVVYRVTIQASFQTRPTAKP